MRVGVMNVGITCVPSLKISTVPSLKLLPTMITCTIELPLTTDPGVTLTICGVLPVKHTLAPQDSMRGAIGRTSNSARAGRNMDIPGRNHRKQESFYCKSREGE